MGSLEIAEAKNQLERISESLSEPLVLIGGLAVNQHVRTRNSQDIDLVCDYETAQTLVRDLYPTSKWSITEKNEDDYRPSFEVRHRHDSSYPTIKFGPKIIERDVYPMLTWEQLKKGATPFKHKRKSLKNVLVPTVESLLYSKILSFIGRSLEAVDKIRQDVWDIRELANLDEFRVVLLNDIIESSMADRSTAVATFHERAASLQVTFDGCSLTSVSQFFFNNTSAMPHRQTIVQHPVLQSADKSDAGPRRLAAFDLDGTLIKGMRHSWTLVWNHVCSGNTSQYDRKLRFQQRELSYAEWCRLDGEMLRQNGLCRKHFREIAMGNVCSRTRNLTQAIEKLRAHGFRTAIISGGIDALLYEMIPNADELFDDILINRFVFDDKGVFQYVSPTEYDWDDEKIGVVGKKRGLERLCEKYCMSIKEAAFIGDDHNDLDAMRSAGTKIYYCSESRDQFEKGLPAGIIHIAENDLMRVADQLLTPTPAPL